MTDEVVFKCSDCGANMQHRECGLCKICRPISDDELAKMFHNAYEKLAPSFGYKTRTESAVDWNHVPKNNKDLMTAVVHEIRKML